MAGWVLAGLLALAWLVVATVLGVMIGQAIRQADERDS